MTGAEDGVAGAMRLAQQLRRDARELTAARPGVWAQLDLTVLELEFARARGESVDAVVAAYTGVLDRLPATPLPPWVCGGAAQLGWVAVHVQAATGHRVRLDPIDEAVAGWVREFPDDGDLDLPRGLLGLGVYALVHPVERVRAHLVGHVVATIAERIEVDGDGLLVRAGHHPARIVDGSAGQVFAGAAHGVAGLVSFLASVAAARLPASDRAMQLLAGVTRWLMRRRAEPGWGVAYASRRPIWCHGDPGVALALWTAGETVGSSVLTTAATDLARAALNDVRGPSPVTDPSLCHGGAGLVWFLGRAATADVPPSLARDAVRERGRWAALVARERQRGELRYDDGSGAVPESGLLVGLVGTALAVLHSVTGGRPSWEQLLLAGRPVPPHF